MKTNKQTNNNRSLHWWIGWIVMYPVRLIWLLLIVFTIVINMVFASASPSKYKVFERGLIDI